ncbi:hypothetical protein Tco_0791442 [Tanacetum coccineum]
MTVINANVLSNFVSLQCLSSLLNALLQNTMAEQNVPAQPPTRTDEQIVPRSQWLTIGKSNLLFNAQKIQKNPVFQISVDILSNTNFFQAFTASANVPAIYLQQFWKTMSIITRKTGGICTGRNCLQYTDELCVSTLEGNSILAQPVLCRKDYLGCDIPRPSSAKCYGETSLKLINNNIHHRPDSAVHHTGDDYILGTSQKENPQDIDKGVAPTCKHSVCYTQKSLQPSTPVKQTKPAPFSGQTKPSKRKLPQKIRKGKPTFQLVDEEDEARQDDDPDLDLAKKLSLEFIQPQFFFNKDLDYLLTVTIRDPVSEATPELHEVVGKGKAVVTEEQVAHSLIDLSKKKITTDQFILVRRDQTPPDSTTGPSSQPEDNTLEKVIHESSSTSNSERIESETETAAPKDDKDQGEIDSSTVTSGVSIPVSDPEKVHEALAGPDPEPMNEDQTGSDSGNLHVSLAGPNPEHMDDEFLATAYPKVYENLKLITDERVIDDKPESHSGSMSSLKNLDDTFNFGDQFLHDKPTEDDQEKSKAREESDSTIPDSNLIEKYSVLPGPESGQESESKTSRRRLSEPEKGQDEENKIHKSANKNTTNYRLYHALMEALIADEDAMDKEVADKVKDHKRKHDSDDDEDDDDDEGPSAGSNQGRSTKRRRSDSAASGSAKPPPKADDQSSKKPRESDASASKQHPALTSTGWQITDTRDAGADSSMHRSDPESEHSEQSSDDISKQDEGNDSAMEDTDNAHIPKVSTTTWFKPIPESERPATPEPEWTIPPNDFPEPEHNWTNAYAITFKVPEENKLQRKMYDIGSFIKWFCRRTGKKKLCKADLEGPAFNLVKAFHKNRGPPGQVTIQPQFFFNKDLDYLLTGDKERKIALSISKLKAARYLDFGLEELVPSLWVESEREYDISAVYGITHWWFRRKEFYINKHSESSDREAVRSQMRILSVISVKVFEKYGYNYLREIILRRADYQEYKISEKDFRNLHPNDFEDLFLLNIQEKLNHLPKTDKTSLHTAVNMWIRNLVIRNRVGDLQLGIESYQTKINLERPNWDAADYYFKEDYTIVPKPRAVVYRDRNDQRKLMRLNELHKFSDGTLTRVMEKLDQMVKDFHLFEYNKGMETRKWSEDDKRRSKDFITAIEKRLQIRRIYQSLESFVGGRIRDIDYRLINRTT